MLFFFKIVLAIHYLEIPHEFQDKSLNFFTPKRKSFTGVLWGVSAKLWMAFCYNAFVWAFCYQGKAGLTEWVRTFPSSSIFGKVWEGLAFTLFQVFVKIQQWSHQVQASSFWGDFWLLIQSPYLLKIYSKNRFFISSWFSLDRFYVSRICPFHPGYPICWGTIVNSILL